MQLWRGVHSSNKMILKDAEVCRGHSGVFVHFNVWGGPDIGSAPGAKCSRYAPDYDANVLL